MGIEAGDLVFWIGNDDIEGGEYTALGGVTEMLDGEMLQDCIELDVSPNLDVRGNSDVFVRLDECRLVRKGGN